MMSLLDGMALCVANGSKEPKISVGTVHGPLRTSKVVNQAIVVQL